MNDILTIVEHQTISVKKERDIKNNIISYEDRELLFDIEYRDKNTKNSHVFSPNGRNKIKANSIVGSISLKTGLTIEILPKFAKNDLDTNAIKQHREMLLNMIRVSNEQNFIRSSLQSSKISIQEMPLLNYIIELFGDDLLKTLRIGIYTTYNQTIENSSNIRGNILISKTIQNNIVDKSKVYTSHNRHSANNLLMQVFKTLSMLLLKDNNLSYSTKQNLYETTLLLGEVDTIELTQKDFEKVVFNRLNDKFEALFKQAKFIFAKYMPFTSHINAIPFWSILFNMDYLFEKFCTYLFRKSEIEIQEQSVIDCYHNHKYTVSAKPDFILTNKEQQIVVDAKWKILRADKTLYGLNAQNFWQLFSYMNLIDNTQEIKGYFIVPKNSDAFEEEIHFEPIIENNKSITILSIDFSLPFNELIARYRFKIDSDELKIEISEKKLIKPPTKKIETSVLEETDKEKKSINKFNLEEFINELEVLHNDKSLRNNLSPRKKDNRFPNLYSLKDEYDANSKAFKISVKENLVKESWSFENLHIQNIPSNIVKLKKLKHLSFEGNDIVELPLALFQLNSLLILNIARNNIQILPSKLTHFKSLRKLVIDKERVEKSLDIIKNLQEKNVEIVDVKQNDLTEYINSYLLAQMITNNDELIKFDSKKAKEYNSIDYGEAIDIAKESNLLDEYKIILFYREYTETEQKHQIDQIIIEHSSDELKQILKTSIHDLIDRLESNYADMEANHLNWLRGFVYSNNNKAFFKVKVIIAQNTKYNDFIHQLSLEKSENKILFGILANFNIGTSNSYIVSNEVLTRIFNHSKETLKWNVVLGVLKRRELTLALFTSIIEFWHDKIEVAQFKDIVYFDTEINEYIQSAIKKQDEQNIEISKSKIIHNRTVEEYKSMDDNTKMNFIDDADLTSIDNKLLEHIVYYEENIDRLDEFTYNKTLPLKYLVFIYNNHLDNQELKTNIANRNHPILNEITSTYLDNIPSYIEKNFDEIDKEILLGYAMTQKNNFKDIKSKILQLTNDLEIIDELSKDRDNRSLLLSILFKTKNNPIFINKIKSKQTIYSTHTLARIATYTEYPKVAQTLSRNFNLTYETIEYLLEIYQDNQSILENLEKNAPYSLQVKIQNHLAMFEYDNDNNTPMNDAFERWRS